VSVVADVDAVSICCTSTSDSSSSSPELLLSAVPHKVVGVRRDALTNSLQELQTSVSMDVVPLQTRVYALDPLTHSIGSIEEDRKVGHEIRPFS